MLGVDANADLHTADEDNALIGDLLAHSEPHRNDELFLEFCLTCGLEVPGTFSSIQRGEGWSWQHTSGKQKRLDHLLFRPGPWAHSLASQAFDVDIVNTARDHVALRTRSVLTCPRPSPQRTRVKRLTTAEAQEVAVKVWNVLPPAPAAPRHTERLTSDLQDAFRSAVQSLPARPPVTPRQPYLQPATVRAFSYLRDWRSQLRSLQRNVRQTVLWAAFRAWQGRAVEVHSILYQQRLVVGAHCLQERRLQNKVHDRARKDKLLHMLQLTRRATSEWHRTGQPLSAIIHLKWASRRAADRRTVFAAGGYDIEPELEEQFRQQEGGLAVTPGQLSQRLRSWISQPADSCSGAFPSLSDMEQACLRQKEGKAPGPDSLPNEIWKRAPTSAGRWLWRLCMQIAVSGREPAHFQKALQCALYKRGPASLPSNYRSIALLNGTYRLRIMKPAANCCSTVIRP